MYALHNSLAIPRVHTWLGATTPSPGVYEPSFLIGGPNDGPKENGWQFRVRSEVVPQSEMLAHDTPVYIDLFDKNGTDFGPICYRKHEIGKIHYLATKRGTPARFTLRYSATSASKK
jgi:hypothetical protein